jgi:hypothetical protein
MLANAGIKKFVTCGDYPDKSFMPLFNELNIEFQRVPCPELKINKLD